MIFLLHLTVIYAVRTVFGQEGLPQWMINKRDHVIQPMSDQSARILCQMTDVNRIKNYFEPMNKERVVGTANHKQAGQYIKSQLESAGFKVDWDRFTDNTPLGQKTFRNIIATHNQSAPRKFALACHYDSKYFPNFEFIGATDSAMPCAMLIDLAHTLAPYLNRSQVPDLTLQFLFFDGEEAFRHWTASDSIYGARHLAERWQNEWYPSTTNGKFHIAKELDRLDVLMLLDLLGAANPQIRNHQSLGAEHHFRALPQIEKQLRRINCMQNVPQIFFDQASYSLVEDDHIPFLRRRIPILHMIAVPFPSVWHSAKDNADILHYPTIHNLQSVFRVFIARYLNIQL